MAILGQNEGIFGVIDSILIGAGELLAKGARATLEAFEGNSAGYSNSQGGIGDSVSGMVSAVGDWLKGGSEGPAQAQQIAPAMEVQAPAQVLAKYEVSPAELGNFSSPAFGNAGHSAGIGMNM